MTDSQGTNVFHNDLIGQPDGGPAEGKIDAPAEAWDVPLEDSVAAAAGSAPAFLQSDAPAPNTSEEVQIDFVASSTTGDRNLQAGTERAAPFAGGGPSNGGKTNMFQIAHYQQYFNVDTMDVVKRILGAMIFRKDLFVEVEASPDLYGPFWLSTTAIFLMAMISNALDWIAQRAAWEGDLEKIAYGAAILYGYVFGGGFLLWVWLKVISLAQISLISLWCIYGYSMAIWLPVTLLAIVPKAIFLWSLCMGASLYSGIFLVLNLKLPIQESLMPSRQVVTLGVIFGAHQLVGLLLRVYVFTYNLPPKEQ
eukprot:jgi/Ulvmu1/3649/UM017_0063.1